MIDRNMYSGGGINLNVKEILAEDMPLCSVEQVIEGARKMIEEGYIQQVLSLRFGYVVLYTAIRMRNGESRDPHTTWIPGIWCRHG